MTRYTLVDQVHFLANVPKIGDAVVTLQHWQSSAKNDRAVYVVTYNGQENSRRLLTTADDLAKLRAHFETTRDEHAEDLLSEDGAADEVVRRGGPGPRYCMKTDCGAMVPYAAATCADGDPFEGRSRVEFLSVTQRTPELTVVTGGKR